MNNHETRFQALLARISRGAVPMDGIYWLEPKDGGKADVGTARPDTADPGTSKPRRDAAPERQWPPASLSWFLPRS